MLPKIWAVQLVLSFESRNMHCLTSDMSYTFWLVIILNVELAMESSSDVRSFFLEATDGRASPIRTDRLE